MKWYQYLILSLCYVTILSLVLLTSNPLLSGIFILISIFIIVAACEGQIYEFLRLTTDSNDQLTNLRLSKIKQRKTSTQIKSRK